MKLKGKITVITGASSGMGRAMSMLFAAEGAHVVAAARREKKLDEIAAEAEKRGQEILAIRTDVASKNDLDNLVETTMKEHGKIDVLVNNAGVMDDFSPIADTTDEMWEKVISINLNAPFHLCRKIIPIMLEQGGGVIINISSIAGLRSGRGGAAYTVSKYGLIGLTGNTAFMYADKGIRCNVICPGAVETEIMHGFTDVNGYGAARCKSGMANMPRKGAAEEIARIALFLATEDSSFVNGVALTADGGWTTY